MGALPNMIDRIASDIEGETFPRISDFMMFGFSGLVVTQT
jgi:hypothetical protein